MTNHRLTQLDHVSQLLNVHLRTFLKLIERADSELEYIRSSSRQLMFLYEKLEEEKDHYQILKEFNKTVH
ncbi:MAG: hypothetical protein B7Y25_08550 [Alphaproteobacteria bacterium 16-39-46]|nr:MAG: hypothetical protein B7Y25_08550 [Alphaproteobacteria bacterium 16-39-46]HQS85035.1 hypothetical protein [Alphaproteobacteria bacterium]HQS94476.1 hypothetical protein [Alphaproteobacteria bacterium]